MKFAFAEHGCVGSLQSITLSGVQSLSIKRKKKGIWLNHQILEIDGPD